MKKSFLFLLILLASYSYSQSVNDYKAVIVPLKYDFLKNENQYRLNTLTKFNLGKAGFISFYNKETIPAEYNDRCSLLYANVERENGFLITKLYIIFKDCNDKIIFKSNVGKSKEKDFQTAYLEAFNEAFQSVYDLHYKYSGIIAKPQTEIVPTASQVTSIETIQSNIALNDPNLLYAQATPTGFQLIDSTPKVVMKLMKTSQNNSFIAIKDAIQGSLILKDNQWFFEFYKNDQLISKKVNVKL